MMDNVLQILRCCTSILHSIILEKWLGTARACVESN